MNRFWILIGLLAGCAVDAAPDSASGASPESPSGVTVTAVQLTPGGAPQVARTSITPAQRDALIAHGAAKAAAGSRANALIVDDNPCVLASTFVYDRGNYDGNILCITGTGRFDLSSFVHDWEWIDDGIFGIRLEATSWNRLAASIWETAYTVELFEDGRAEPYQTVGPQDGLANFVTRNHGLPFAHQIVALNIY